MMKTLTAAALSLTVALTSLSASATPARAGGDDFGKFLFGAVALGIIAAGIAEANNNNRATVQVNRNQPPRHAHAPRNNPPRHAHAPRRNHRFDVPANCATRARVGRHGQVRTVYAKRCLQRNNVATRRADACVRTGNIRGRHIAYYTRACLRRTGYNL